MNKDNSYSRTQLNSDQGFSRLMAIIPLKDIIKSDGFNKLDGLYMNFKMLMKFANLCSVQRRRYVGSRDSFEPLSAKNYCLYMVKNYIFMCIYIYILNVEPL